MLPITVVIPAYNAELYIDKCLTSVLQQTESVVKVIVVNDGSTDNTITILEELALKYTQLYIINQPNSGVSAARNNGILNATTEWILLLDADDELELTIIEEYWTKIQNYNSENQPAAVYTGYRQIDENSTIVSPEIIGCPLKKSEGVCDVFLRNPIISPSGVLISRTKALDEGLFNANLKYDEDVDLWIRLLEVNHIDYIEKPLTRIRRHMSNTTKSLSTSLQAEKQLLLRYGLNNLREKFFSRQRTNVENIVDYGAILNKFELYSECAELLNQLKVEKTDKYYTNYLFQLSVSLCMLGQLEAAKIQLTEFLKLDPDNGAVLNNLGAIHAIYNEKDKAEHYFQLALNKFPNYLDANYNYDLLMGNKQKPYKFTLRQLRPVILNYTSH